MNKVNNIIIYVLLVGIISFLIYSQCNKTQTVYVDNMELFSSFKMKAELEKKYKEVETLRKNILDSLYSEIRIMNESSLKKDPNVLNDLKREFLIKKETFDKENTETMNQYNEQIWNQINEYTKQFGKEKKYEFILGANGQGVLMYAIDTKNVTKELTEYINQKYSGK